MFELPPMLQYLQMLTTNHSILPKQESTIPCHVPFLRPPFVDPTWWGVQSLSVFKCWQYA